MRSGRHFAHLPLSAAIFALVNLVGVAAKADDKPKSNPFARANVLSKNELSISIKHSDWGQKAAYQFAADHCAKYGKVAIQSTSGKGYGPDTTTTWICQEPPKVPAPPAP